MKADWQNILLAARQDTSNLDPPTTHQYARRKQLSHQSLVVGSGNDSIRIHNDRIHDHCGV